MNKREETALYNDRACANLQIDSYTLQRLQRLSRRLRKLYEQECNGTDREKYAHETWEQFDAYREKIQARIERQQARVQAEVTRLAAYHNLRIYHQTDCRGAAIYLQRPEIEPVMTDCNYNTTGICIY